MFQQGLECVTFRPFGKLWQTDQTDRPPKQWHKSIFQLYTLKKFGVRHIDFDINPIKQEIKIPPLADRNSEARQ